LFRNVIPMAVFIRSKVSAIHAFDRLSLGFS
jgi:hypothetical protein